MERWIPVILSIGFMVSVFRRFLYRRSPYLLARSFGLFLYGLGTLSEAVLSITFSGLMLKLWYLCGAMLTAAWLGQGTIFLLVRKRGAAPGLAGLMGLATLAALGLVLPAPHYCVCRRLSGERSYFYPIPSNLNAQWRDDRPDHPFEYLWDDWSGRWSDPFWIPILAQKGSP
ncbi:MAG TPA: hypothetical protein VMS73_06165 [Anaerolineaceae bacterium]|nr:hypothetical protein [Anaerolineaceae bacterium]